MFIHFKNGLYFMLIILAQFIMIKQAQAAGINLNGMVQPRGWERELLEQNSSNIFIYLESGSIGEKHANISKNGNFNFNNIPSHETVTLWWQLENKHNNGTQAKYVLLPRIIGGPEHKAKDINNPTFIFRKLDWMHITAKKKAIHEINSGNFEAAGKVYDFYYPYYLMFEPNSTVNKHYRLLQEMCSSALKILSRRSKKVTKNINNITVSIEWFTERLTIAGEKEYFNQRDSDLFPALVEWSRFAKLAYSKRRNWPAKALKDLQPGPNDLKMFRWKEAYDWMHSDIELIINLLTSDAVASRIDKLSQIPGSEISLEWKTQLNSSALEIDLNALSNFLTVLNRERMN